MGVQHRRQENIKILRKHWQHKKAYLETTPSLSLSTSPKSPSLIQTFPAFLLRIMLRAGVKESSSGRVDSCIELHSMSGLMSQKPDSTTDRSSERVETHSPKCWKPEADNWECLRPRTHSSEARQPGRSWMDPRASPARALSNPLLLRL